MSQWMLTATTKGPRNKYRKNPEIIYHYRSSDGRKVAFHSHPTKAFCHVGVEGAPTDLQEVVEKFIGQGLKQHQYPGGFDEAIKVLE